MTRGERGNRDGSDGEGRARTKERQRARRGYEQNVPRLLRMAAGTETRTATCWCGQAEGFEEEEGEMDCKCGKAEEHTPDEIRAMPVERLIRIAAGTEYREVRDEEGKLVCDDEGKPVKVQPTFRESVDAMGELGRRGRPFQVLH